MAGVIGWMTGHPWAAIPLATLGWGLFVLASPYRECRWCREGGRLARLPGPARRCWRCGNTRLTRRIGARLVHKVKLSLIQAWEERGDGR